MSAGKHGREDGQRHAELAHDIAPRLRSRQILTVVLLFGGYAACYFCRADLSVAAPLLIDELGSDGVSHADALVHIGQIASLGVFAYAIGKLFLTGLGDFWGGRPNFLIGLGGATVFTVLFTLGGALPVFTIAWLGNRLTQSIAWAGLIKVSSKWFDFTSHGTIVEAKVAHRGAIRLRIAVDHDDPQPAPGSGQSRGEPDDAGTDYGEIKSLR